MSRPKQLTSRRPSVLASYGGHDHSFAMINPTTKRMKPRKVDVDGESYECARRYMIRLDERDFADPEKLAAIAKAANLSPEQFRERFGYLVARER